MSQVSTYKLNWWRIILGFVLGPLIPSLVFSLIVLDEPGTVILVLIYGALPGTIIFGIPIFILLYRRVQPHVVTITLIGGLVASLPWALIMFAPGASHAELGNCVTIENGRTTWCGFLSNMEFLSQIFAFGAFGGLIFWFCAVWRNTPPEDQSTAEIST